MIRVNQVDHFNNMSDIRLQNWIKRTVENVDAGMTAI